MKKLFLIAIAGIGLLLAACSNGSSKSENASTDGIETVTTSRTELDVERIMSFKSYKGSQMTENDYDFLLDQLEILVDKANELPADQAKNFINTLDKDQQDAAMIVALMLMDQSKFTDKQKKRFHELEERDPTQK